MSTANNEARTITRDCSGFVQSFSRAMPISLNKNKIKNRIN